MAIRNTPTNHILIAHKPTLHEVQGGRHLLVWGDLAQWMVVDDELYALLGSFDGHRPTMRVLHEHARGWNKSLDTVKRAAEPAIKELVARGVLATKRTPLVRNPEPIRIANITINLTNRCNLRCPWCYNAGRVNDEMPVEQLMEAVEAARSIFDETCSFIVLGGEPFMDRDRLWFALDRAGPIFAPAPMVSTNGTFLDERTVSELACRRVEVQVSLDSHSPSRHDAMRGSGVHAKAVRGIQLLVRARVYTIMSMVYTRQSLEDLEPYLELALKLGATEARFIPLRLVGGGLAAKGDCPDQRITMKKLLDILRRRPEFRPLLLRDFFSIVYTSCRFSTHRTSCGIGRRVVLIDADGAVYPCPNHVRSEFKAGSILTHNLAEIVRDSPVMRRVRECYQVSRYRRCSSCSFRHWCAGDCRGEVLALTGDTTAPSPHCDELQDVYKEMLWLIASGDVPLGVAESGPNGKATIDTFR